MATISFDKKFVVTDDDAVAQIRHDLAHPRKVTINAKDRSAEKRKGLRALQRQLSRLKTS